MTYTIAILRRAKKELSELPQDIYIRVRDAIRLLAEEPRPNGSKKLIGRPAWRLRVFSYRIIYEIDDVNHLITIMNIGHRKDIYK